jgi:beta-aspartyl-dipeptidase (metallo-type)
MILIKNIELYDPTFQDTKDILLGGGKVLEISDNIEIFSKKIKVIDGSGKYCVPGFIDNHVHVTGGGGEASFRSRAPEVELSKLIEGGITTVVGLLGTDSTSRSIENLLAKVKALNEEGITAYCLTGSYTIPSITITGDIRKDIAFIDQIIGLKVALSDHRSTNPTKEEFYRAAAYANIGGILSGKAGLVVCHMGDGKDGLKYLNDLKNEAEIPIKNLLPTHINRNEKLLEEGLSYIKEGGNIDLTCMGEDELRPANIIMRAIDQKFPLENITISSDGQGSWSKYDQNKNLLAIGISSVKALYEEFLYLVVNKKLALEKALPFFTSNVAKILKIYPQKGAIFEGSDADILILYKNFSIDTVIAKGKILKEGGKIKVFGTYEG